MPNVVIPPLYEHEQPQELLFSTVALHAGKPLCPPDGLGRPCRCVRCVAILASRHLAALSRKAAA